VGPMAAVPLADFHEAVRTLLGDEGDAVAGYDYQTAQIDGALRTVVRMGFLPCLELAPAEGAAQPAGLVSAPANADTWGYLVAKAALLLIGGGIQESFRTRALSVSSNPASRRDAVSFLETMLSDLDARGNLCGEAGVVASPGLFGTAADVMTCISFPVYCSPALLGSTLT
jgi:hypothetical protein